MTESRPARTVEVELPDGEVVLARVAVADAGGDAGFVDRLKLDDAGRSVVRLGEWALRSVRDSLPDKPDRIDLEFGVTLAVKSGKLTSVLAEASGEASFVVKLGWDNLRDRK
jgi:hypothetical protein